MSVQPSAATLEASLGAALAQFAALAVTGAADAASLAHTVYGLDDGNDYGRYFYGQDPLVTFADSAASIPGLIAQGALLYQNVVDVATAAIAGGSDPSWFGQAAAGLTETLRTACANPADAVRILSWLALFQVVTPKLVVAGDPIGFQLYLLSALGALRLRLAAAASLVRATATYQPTSREDAATVRDNVCDLLDGLALICADLFLDQTNAAIDAARVAVFQDLSARGADLASIVTLRLAEPAPACVVAYRLYGDATRSADLVARNSPPNPGFLPVTIEALSA